MPFTHNGVTYKSVLAACLAHGANYHNTLRRVKQGWTLSDALVARTYDRKPPNKEQQVCAKLSHMLGTREHDATLIQDMGREIASYLRG
jgi:hypothetical protein